MQTSCQHLPPQFSQLYLGESVNHLNGLTHFGEGGGTPLSEHSFNFLYLSKVQIQVNMVQWFVRWGKWVGEKETNEVIDNMPASTCTFQSGGYVIA